MAPGNCLGRYEILGPLGKGGFGRVWLARAPSDSPNSQPLVAIKRLRLGKIFRTGQGSRMNKLEAAFRYEAQLCSYLDHPNVVRVIEVLHSGNHCSLVMEFINGLGLDELLAQQAERGLPFPPDLALDIVRRAGEGLEYAHTACAPDGRPLNLVHRDIKPGNIMVSRTGEVKVMDFGVARSSLNSGLTTAGTIKGTLRYLSPEQADGSREIGPASDQFALALVLTELLTGQQVYDAERDQAVLLMAVAARVSASVERADALCPGVGPILARALAYSPEDRYRTVGAFVNALNHITAPSETFFGLAEWVHRGLEDRARAAAENGEVLDPGSSSSDLGRVVGLDASGDPAAYPAQSDGWDTPPRDLRPPVYASDDLVIERRDNTREQGPEWEMIDWAASSDTPIEALEPSDNYFMVPGASSGDWKLAKRGGDVPPPWAIPSSTTVRRPSTLS